MKKFITLTDKLEKDASSNGSPRKTNSEHSNMGLPATDSLEL